MNIRISLQVNNRLFWSIDKSIGSVTELYVFTKETSRFLQTLAFSTLLSFYHRTS